MAGISIKRVLMSLLAGIIATLIFSFLQNQFSIPGNLGQMPVIYFVGFTVFCYFAIFRKE